MVGVLAYLVRVCLSTAIVGAQGMGAELGWSVKDNGFVLSGFFWGYMLGNFPSGIFASRYGSRKILLASMILQSILTVLSPAVSRHGGLYAFFFLRVLLGFAQSPVYPVAQSLFAAWLNADERAGAFSIMDAGSYCGGALTLGYGAHIQNALGSWEDVFYLFGSLCGVFAVYVYFRVQSFPSKCTQSTAGVDVPQNYHTLNGGDTLVPRATNQNVPWIKLLCRTDIFAAIIGPFSINWSLFMFLTYLPKYLQEQFRFDMSSEHNSMHILVYPYFLCGVIGVFCGCIADKCVRSDILSTTQIRKIFQLIAASFATGALIFLQYSSSTTSLVILLCFAISPGGILGSASAANPMDLSKKYAGVIKGLANGFATFGGAFNPILVGYLLSNGGCPSDEQFKLNRTAALDMASCPPCKQAWDNAFTIAACICVCGCHFSLVWVREEIEIGDTDIQSNGISDKRHARPLLDTPLG